jgi:hypothetical protein
MYNQLDLKVKITEYENRVAILLQEIERLNVTIRSQQEHVQLAQQNSRISSDQVLKSMDEMNALKNTLAEVTLQNNTYRRREAEFEDGLRRNTEKENRINNLCQ